MPLAAPPKRLQNSYGVRGGGPVTQGRFRIGKGQSGGEAPRFEPRKSSSFSSSAAPCAVTSETEGINGINRAAGLGGVAGRGAAPITTVGQQSVLTAEGLRWLVSFPYPSRYRRSPPPPSPRAEIEAHSPRTTAGVRPSENSNYPSFSHRFQIPADRRADRRAGLGSKHSSHRASQGGARQFPYPPGSPTAVATLAATRCATRATRPSWR